MVLARITHYYDVAEIINLDSFSPPCCGYCVYDFPHF